MSVDVGLVVVTRTGILLRRRERHIVRSLGDPRGVFVGLLERLAHQGRTPTPTLDRVGRVGRSGSLELRSDQMPPLIAELGYVRACSDDLRELAYLARLSSMARECAVSSARVLIFEGDRSQSL